jgi:type I restriction enzyme R subunit
LAKKQYRDDRDPQETLFNFKRCPVHFAVDPDEVWMTTKSA